MQYQEFMLSGMIFNAINNALENLKTGVIFFDIIITISALLLYNIFSDSKNTKEIFNFFNKFFSGNKDEIMILFVSKRGACSQVFRSLLYHLSKEPDKKNICNLIEDTNSKYNRWGDYNDEEEIKTLYRVNQQEDFKFTDNIGGRIYTEKEESSEHNGKIKYEETVNLEVFTTELTLEELQLFIERCHESYKKNLKEKLVLNQSIITIESVDKKSSEDDNNDVNVKKKDWYSFKTFDNTFFPSVNDVVNKIDFFINNRSWYEKKGLPWTLGIMLSGIPGSGKTSFIKALMNYTGRHCINVKLDDDFKMNQLEEILADEEIDCDIVVPIEKRIVVLEDIDCMGDIVKDRDIREEEEKNSEYLLNNKLMKAVSETASSVPISAADLLKRESKFNLSKLLNIIDGLDEHPGRILVITTNKPDRLDKALIRPGRIDIKLHFDNAVEEDIHNIINHFWEYKPDDSLDMISLEKYDRIFSPASIINFCRMSDSYENTIKLIDKKYLELIELEKSLEKEINEIEKLKKSNNEIEKSNNEVVDIKKSRKNKNKKNKKKVENKVENNEVDNKLENNEEENKDIKKSNSSDEANKLGDWLDNYENDNSKVNLNE